MTGIATLTGIKGIIRVNVEQDPQAKSVGNGARKGISGKIVPFLHPRRGSPHPHPEIPRRTPHPSPLPSGTS